MSENTRSGFVAIVGKPNVGKSTLLNYLLGTKLSITSKKPQTTRHRIVGVKTADDMQIVFVDTPGIHMQQKRQINRYMNRAARAILHDVDVIVLVVDAANWDRQDEWVLRQLEKVEVPVILALNKVDTIKDKKQILPLMEELSQKYNFTKIVPIAAKHGTQIDELENAIRPYMQENPFFYDPEKITDRSDRFIASEIVREKLMRLLGEEVPYALTVTIELFEEAEKLIKISAVIWVERAGQKAIVIGKDGAKLKEVGQKARLDMEKFFGKKVFLQLWVKIKTGWSDDKRDLARFGYDDN